MQQEDHPLNLVLIDGFADCEGESRDTISPTILAGRVTVIQIPANGHNTESADLIDKRKAFLQALFPTGKVFPVYIAGQACDALFR